MSSSKFVSNLDGMNEGENFSKDLLKVRLLSLFVTCGYLCVAEKYLNLFFRLFFFFFLELVQFHQG